MGYRVKGGVWVWGRGGVWGCRREGVQGYLGEGVQGRVQGGVGRAGGLPGGLGRGSKPPQKWGYPDLRIAQGPGGSDPGGASPKQSKTIINARPETHHEQEQRN